MHRCCLALLVVLTTAGCFSYTRVGLESASPGTRVAADLSAHGMVAAEPMVGSDVEVIEGTVVSRTNESLEIAVARTRTRGGRWNTWSGERVSIDGAGVATLRQRQFSKMRTVLTTAIIAASLFLGGELNIPGFPGSGDRDPGGNQPNPGET